MENRIQRLQANMALQHTIAALSGYLSGRQYEKMTALFSRREDVWASMPWGTYRGHAGLERLFGGLYAALYGGAAGRPGLLSVHCASTPVITVSPDCREAVGSWTSPGVCTISEEETKALHSYWLWQQVQGSFVLEDGSWRLQSLQVSPLITTAFQKPWTEAQRAPWSSIPAEFAPDGPPKPAPGLPADVGFLLQDQPVAPWDRSQEARIARLELLAEAQRLMGVYAAYVSAGAFDWIPELFALDASTVRAELLSGVYRGAEEIRRLYRERLPAMTMMEEAFVTLETPVITAAGDCQTARGVWVSPGYRTIRESDGTRHSVFAWRKYAADFLVTEGRLRFWHLHEYGLFDSQWGSEEIRSAGTLDGTLSIPADHPPTTAFPLSPDSVYPYEPAVPREYGVYDPDYGC